MSYTYHGIELVNCSPPKQRKGPLEKFTFGRYVGRPVSEVIRRDPHYIMWAVKEFLDLSPSQAFLFEQVTGGGIIPDAYISDKEPKRMVVDSERKSPPSPPSPVKSPPVKVDKIPDPVPEWPGEDCTWPNLGFIPEMAPGWWEEFETKRKGLTGRQAKWLYEHYQWRQIEELKEMWKNEYRGTCST